MASAAQVFTDAIPLWILKWRMPATARGRGRAHMALFLPNLEERERNPLDSTSSPACYGTLFLVVGSPFTGYAHDVRHGYDSLSDKHIGSAANIGNIVANKTPSHSTAVGIGDKNSVQEYLEQRAFLLRAPGVARNLFKAEEIRSCQNWVHDFVSELVAQGMLGRDAIQIMKRHMDDMESIMGQMTGGAAVGDLTASMMKSGQPSSNDPDGERSTEDNVGSPDKHSSQP